MPALGYLVFTANKTLVTTLIKWVRAFDTKRLALAFSLESLCIRATPRLKLILRYSGAAPGPQPLMTERCITVFLICVKPKCQPLSHD
ncbi:MAG: hypothetical protein CMP84_04385 [Gammaproteobacteria bacterium]|nr:hypothetical protein [Gammaproteobacteria bacterium]MBU14793.1 hypothetical protein [Gammaproteobacteria bacterium]